MQNLSQIVEFIDDLNVGHAQKHSDQTINAVLVSLADALAKHWQRSVQLSKVTKRDAILTLLTLGAAESVAEKYGAKLASKLRARRFEFGSWSSVI